MARPCMAGEPATSRRPGERRAVHRTLPFTLSCQSLAVLWYAPAGRHPGDVDAQATHVLEAIDPSGAVALARCELAAEFLQDVRRIDTQLCEINKKLAVAVRASGTTATEVFGVGPVIAATVIGDVRDVSRFASRDHFLAVIGEDGQQAPGAQVAQQVPWTEGLVMGRWPRAAAPGPAGSG